MGACRRLFNTPSNRRLVNPLHSPAFLVSGKSLTRLTLTCLVQGRFSYLNAVNEGVGLRICFVIVIFD
jgi:hypothetical protein